MKRILTPIFIAVVLVVLFNVVAVGAGGQAGPSPASAPVQSIVQASQQTTPTFFAGCGATEVSGPCTTTCYALPDDSMGRNSTTMAAWIPTDISGTSEFSMTWVGPACEINFSYFSPNVPEYWEYPCSSGGRDPVGMAFVVDGETEGNGGLEVVYPVSHWLLYDAAWLYSPCW